MNLIELATLFRIINLYAHHAHNMASGATFMQDHAFFAEVYTQADENYDALIERHIGTVDDNVDLCAIIKDSYDLIEKMSDDYYQTIFVLLKECVNSIDEMSKDGKLSSGTLNLIQGQADMIEILIYKIKRRLK
jgi:DNA-binding ferritin-like protein